MRGPRRISADASVNRSDRLYDMLPVWATLEPMSGPTHDAVVMAEIANPYIWHVVCPTCGPVPPTYLEVDEAEGAAQQHAQDALNS